MFAAASITAKTFAVVATIATISGTVYIANNSNNEPNNKEQIVISENNNQEKVIEPELVVESEPITEPIEKEPVKNETHANIEENNNQKADFERLSPQSINPTKNNDESPIVNTYVPKNTGNDNHDSEYYKPNLQIEKTVDFSVDDLLFRKNSLELVPNSIIEMNYLLENLKRDSKLKVLIIGYADKKEKKKEQKSLSVDRGYIIWKYLIEKGIKPSRVSYRGFGSVEKYSSKTEEGRTLNRRVELLLSY